MMKATFACVIAASMIAVAGCGDGSEDRLSVAEFNEQATAICKEAVQKKEALFAKAAGEYEGAQSVSKQDEAKVATEAILTPLREQVAGLSELELPEGDHPELAAMMRAFQKALKEGEANPIVLLDSQTIYPARVAAREAGIDACRG